MKNRRPSRGPFSEQPYYTESEIEQTCEDALKSAGYLPSAPEPVKIERFIEKYFDVVPRYDDLPDGVLGYSCFGPSGMTSMHIAAALTETGRVSDDRRVNTTLAHEAGHGLFHGHLFALATPSLSLFGSDADVTATKILCRDEQTPSGGKRGYDGRWWEHQAHKAIGPLLMPKALVREAVRPFLAVTGLLGLEDLPAEHREEAIRHLSATFDVNGIVARIRLDGIYKPSGPQLTL